MKNMTYVAMQNTYADLTQCLEILQEKGISGLSESERAYASRLAKLCEQFAEAHAECVVLEAD